MLKSALFVPGGGAWHPQLVRRACAVASGNQGSERIDYIGTRLYVNGFQSASSCPLYVLKNIVKEHNAVCRCTDCPDNKALRRRPSTVGAGVSPFWLCL